MMEEWKNKGELLQELDFLRGRIARLEKTEQKSVGGTSEEIGRRLRRIYDNVAEGVLFADLLSERFIIGNKAICKMLDYNPETTTSLPISSVFPGEESSNLLKQFERQVSGEMVFRKDVPIRRKDGDLIYTDFISVPLTISNRLCLMCFLRKASTLPKDTFVDSRKSQLLTETEIKVLKSIAKGMSSKEIAKLFRRSVRTIENHRAHIMKKLNVDSSIELVKRAITMGLVDLSGEQERGKPPEIR
jgi:PAS domain S-box-containing protein